MSGNYDQCESGIAPQGDSSWTHAGRQPRLEVRDESHSTSVAACLASLMSRRWHVLPHLVPGKVSLLSPRSMRQCRGCSRLQGGGRPIMAPHTARPWGHQRTAVSLWSTGSQHSCSWDEWEDWLDYWSVGRTSCSNYTGQEIFGHPWDSSVHPSPWQPRPVLG